MSIHLMLSFQSFTFKSKNNFKLSHKHVMELLVLIHIVKDILVLRRKAPNNNTICLEYYSHFQFFEMSSVIGSVCLDGNASNRKKKKNQITLQVFSPCEKETPLKLRMDAISFEKELRILISSKAPFVLGYLV